MLISRMHAKSFHVDFSSFLFAAEAEADTHQIITTDNTQLRYLHFNLQLTKAKPQRIRFECEQLCCGSIFNSIFPIFVFLLQFWVRERPIPVLILSLPKSVHIED